jgi:hypothetical protein
MRKTAMLAALVVTAAASAAQADLVKANWAIVSGTSTEAVTNITPFNETRFQAVDGLFGIDAFGAGPSNGQYVIDFFYNDTVFSPLPGGNPNGQVETDIFCGAAQSNVTVNSIVYFNQGAGIAAGSASDTALIGSPVTLVAGRNRFIPGGFLLVNNFDIGTYNAVRVTFVFPNGTVADRLQIDMVSNPEPGTIALFAMGALGLGGFAWRRKNAKKLPVQS